MTALAREIRRFGPVAAATAFALAIFVGVGAYGVERYGMNYWLYRGFPPPHDAAYVVSQGSEQTIKVSSAALGGRQQPVVVYLPPGYASQPQRRYPVLYLLHGFPGRPQAFLDTVRMGVVEDDLVALGIAQPLILVMPFGSTGQFTDKEWANGAGASQGWETFVARDVVHAIDARFRTIPTGAARAIGGLSEGGYGAINIALHHPGEFGVVESWSGYERPDRIRSIYGVHLGLLARNDPLAELPALAPRLRSLGTYFWLYSGASDSMRGQNALFAAELARAHIPYRFFEPSGGHNWALWRAQAQHAYLAAARRLRA
jgi:S-formylglutathione hydrolase FrmB